MTIDARAELAVFAESFHSWRFTVARVPPDAASPVKPEGTPATETSTRKTWGLALTITGSRSKSKLRGDQDG